MSKKMYMIGVHGCDDSAELKMKLSEEEAEAIKRVAEMCTAMSAYCCMPTMEIEVTDDD